MGFCVVLVKGSTSYTWIFGRSNTLSKATWSECKIVYNSYPTGCNVKNYSIFEPVRRRSGNNRSKSSPRSIMINYFDIFLQPSLMNFCVTYGETVIATRYVSSKTDEAASLVGIFFWVLLVPLNNFLPCYSGSPQGQLSVSLAEEVITRCQKPTNEKASSW